MSSEIAGTSSSEDKSEPFTEKVLGSKRKIISVQEEYLFLVEVVNTDVPGEAESKYVPMQRHHPFAVLMYERLKYWYKNYEDYPEGEKQPLMDYTLCACDYDGNEGDGKKFVAELDRHEVECRSPGTMMGLSSKKRRKNPIEDGYYEYYEIDLNNEWRKMLDAAYDSDITPYQARTVYGQIPWVRIVLSQD